MLDAKIPPDISAAIDDLARASEKYGDHWRWKVNDAELEVLLERKTAARSRLDTLLADLAARAEGTAHKAQSGGVIYLNGEEADMARAAALTVRARRR